MPVSSSSLAILVSSAALALAAVPAKDAWAHGGIPKELAALDAKLEGDPFRASWLVERAALERRRGHYRAALADLNDAYESEPELAAIALERGLALAALGAHEAADWDLSGFLREHPDHVKGLLARAAVRRSRGQSDEARADLRRALKVEPSVDAVLALGALEEDAGRLDEAAAAYARGLDDLGDALVLRMALVRTETARRRYDRALEVLDEVIAKARVPADLRLTRAEILAAAGRGDEARRERQEALQELDAALLRRPSMLRRMSRAKALMALDRDEEARGELEEIVETMPDLHEARELLERARR